MGASKRLMRVLGQSSWRMGSDRVEAYLTRSGGHLAPVRFRIANKWIEPYSVAPWHKEKLPKGTDAVLRMLRGDFFCLPFGGNATAFENEKHPPHGETATKDWKLMELQHSAGCTHAVFELPLTIRPGAVKKEILLRDGETVVYQRHTISRAAGAMPLGHHAMLKFPEEHGSGVLSTSRFVYGQVFPGMFEYPDVGGYQSLKPGATFESLKKVPLSTGGETDLTLYPARRGFEDLVMLVSDPGLELGWNAVVFARDGYVWFALRDPRVLKNTVLWISNGGRHYAPWNGRHTSVMGIEDVISNFHQGLAESASANAMTKRGMPTAMMLTPETPTVVNYISGVAAIPHGFDHVKAIEPGKRGVVLRAGSGKQVEVSLDVGFLRNA